ncbi:MAG: 6-bladed beta-propeller [Acidobacteria bacterium]|nr:6-bladed beta-propeller [Acidobacteriota bacterium]
MSDVPPESGPLSVTENWGVSSRGDLLIVDRQEQSVLWFDASGHFKRTVGGTGDRPGRYASPWSARFGPRGEIVVCDAGRNRLVLYDPGGQFLRNIEGLATPGEVIMLPGNRFVLGGPVGSGKDLYYFHLHDADGSLLAKAVPPSSRVRPKMTPGLNFSGLAIGPAENIYVAQGYEYEIWKLNSEGKVISRFGRPGATYHPPPAKPPGGYHWDVEGVGKWLQSWSPILGLYFVSDTLLVLYGDPAAGDGLPYLDLYRPDGRVVAQGLKPPGWPVGVENESFLLIANTSPADFRGGTRMPGEKPRITVQKYALRSAK